jgi:hypothetical protein
MMPPADDPMQPIEVGCGRRRGGPKPRAYGAALPGLRANVTHVDIEAKRCGLQAL